MENIFFYFFIKKIYLQNIQKDRNIKGGSLEIRAQEERGDQNLQCKLQITYLCI